MNNVSKKQSFCKIQWFQSIFLILALLTSPALCCGGLQLLDALPSLWLPSWLDFIVNLFEGEVRIQNNTSQVLFVTAITTNYGAPRVIPQNGFRQRNLPVKPNQSTSLQYDSDDFPLSAIVVCRTSEDCRLLRANSSDIYELNSFESLENLEPGWLETIQVYPTYNYDVILTSAFSFVPIILFSSWLYLTRRERKRVG